MGIRAQYNLVLRAGISIFEQLNLMTRHLS